MSHLRKFTLLLHIASSVGWLGAVIPYLALATASLIAKDTTTAQSVYPSLAIIGWFVLFPLSLAAFLSGLVESLTTPWGLFRHWWIVAKLGLTVLSTAILLKHLAFVSQCAQMARAGQLSSADLHAMGTRLFIHPFGGLIALFVVTALSVFKPRGLTPYGRRILQQVSRKSAEVLHAPPATQIKVRPRRIRSIGVHAAHALGVTILMLVVLHLVQEGMMRH